MEPTYNPLPEAIGATIKQPVRQPNITAAGASFQDVAGAGIGNRPAPQPRPAPVNVLRAGQQQAVQPQNPRESSGVITQAQLPDPPVQQPAAQTPEQPQAASPSPQDQAPPWWAGVPTTETRTGLELEQARRAAAGSMASADPIQAIARFGVMGSGPQQQQPQAAPAPASGPVSAASGFAPVNPLAAKVDPLMQPNSNAQFMTGQGGKAPDSSGNGFFDGKTAYTVNPTSQTGIQKVTAAGKNPLITNIRPEDAVSGLNNQTMPGETQEGIARSQRANDIRQSLIDAQPVGGVAVLPDQNAIDNAEKTQRWREEDLMAKAKAGVKGAAEALQAHIMGKNALAVEQARGQNQLASEQGRNAVTMRGQDLQSQAEAARLAGNPLANELTKTQIAAGQQANAKTKAQNDLLAQIRGETDPAKRMALIDSLMAGQGKNPAEHRYVKVDGGEEIGPDGMTKIKRPSGVFDTQTQQFIPMTPQAGGNKQGGSAPPAALAYLKANPAQAEAFKAKYGYLPEGL
jgi:hypothetical protein